MISSAVKPDNPEVVAARKLLVPVVRRAEMLGELMRLKWSIAVGGTHGKTTTTSLIAQVLDTAGLDPTVVNGGIINAWGSNARHGSGDWMVAEADESDGTMVKLPATIAVITNIDPEHLDYGTEALREAFVAFAANIPFYGVAALCIDHPEVQGILPRLLDRRVVTYGFSPQADVRGVDVRANGEGVRFTAVITDRKTGASSTVPDLFLPMFGQHNVQNALAALAVAGAVGIDDQVVAAPSMPSAASTGASPAPARSTASSSSTTTRITPWRSRRCWRPRDGDDGQVIAVVQPHRYSRLQNPVRGFCSCFNDADAVIVADIYPAGEEPIEGIDRDASSTGCARTATAR